MNKLFLLLIITVLALTKVNAQSSFSVEDSTAVDYKNYGPQSVKYYKESDLLILHNPKVNSIDTTIKDLTKQYNLVNNEEEPYQDLGAIGSPTRNLYYVFDGKIGQQLGMNSLDKFAYDVDDVPYFDTKSPYSELVYNRTMSNQESMDITFARSINERSGVGFKFTRFSAKQTYGKGVSDLPFTDHYSAYVNGYYITKNKRLKLFGNYRWFNQKVHETGGVFIPDTTVEKYNEFSNQALSQLNQLNGSELLTSQDRRNEVHLGASYSLVDTLNSLNLIYLFDRSRRVNFYQDENFNVKQDLIETNNLEYYQNITGSATGWNYDSTFTQDSTVFKTWDNKLGLNGRAENLSYFAYYRLRLHNFFRNDTLITGINQENFIGGRLNGRFLDEKVLFNAEYETELGGSNQSVFKSSIKAYWLKLSYNHSNILPSILESEYIGNVTEWSNDFKNKKSSNLLVELNVPVAKNVFVKPFYELMNLNNAIYFNEKAQPVQSLSKINASFYGLQFDANSKSVHFRQYVKSYKVGSGEDIFRAPKIYSHTWLAKDFNVFDKAMVLQLGLDLYYRSARQGLWYMPLYQQYYLSDQDFELKQYFTFDFYASGSVKSFIIYGKANNILQPVNSGYYTTAYYPGLQRSFEFGVIWKFYK